MKIKLVDGSVHSVTRAEVTDGRFEIDFKEESCEDIQEIFLDPVNLASIELQTLDGEKFGEVPGYTVYSGIMFMGDTKTVILAQETDKVQERITNAEAKALSASVAAESAKALSEDTASQTCRWPCVRCMKEWGCKT